jgi:hypothetical protein
MNRKEGYYWVKIKGEWEAAYWNPHQRSWFITGSPYSYKDDEFNEIHKTPIPPPNN